MKKQIEVSAMEFRLILTALFELAQVWSDDGFGSNGPLLKDARRMMKLKDALLTREFKKSKETQNEKS